MQYLLNGVVASALIIPVGLGFWLIYRTHGFYNFAYGSFVAVGAYVLYSCLGAGSLVMGVFASLASGAVLGIVLDRLVFARLRHQRTGPLVPLIASLGIYAVVSNMLALFFGEYPKTTRVWETVRGVPVLGAKLTLPQMVIIAASAVCALLFWLSLRSSRVGKQLRAIADDQELARAVGIDVDRLCALSLGIGAAVACVSGMLASLDVDITPRMGMTPMLLGIVAVIIGGNTLWGTVTGALLLGMTRNVGAIVLSTQWQDAITFVILLVFLLFRPQGFLGQRNRKVEL